MNFDHEELMLMMLYNTGTRLGLVHELRLMQCYTGSCSSIKIFSLIGRVSC